MPSRRCTTFARVVASVVLPNALLATLLVTLLVLPAQSFAAAPLVCMTGALPHGSMTSPPDLVVTTGTCLVGAGTYYFHNINILGGGKLQFTDAITDFWAESILIQNNGSLSAGTAAAPIGSAGGHITIHLWGANQGGTATGPSGSGGKGIDCLMSDGKGGYTTDPACGVPSNIWGSNKMDMSAMNPPSCTKASKLGTLLPGNVDDCFYQYEPLVYDDGDPNAYFGYKVLALSYGGTLQLFGTKGASFPAADVPLAPWYTGTSWVHLKQGQDIDPKDAMKNSTLIVERPVDWKAGDQIVVTTTDYLPGHSEQMTIASVDSDKQTIHVTKAFQYPHSGTTLNLGASGVPANVGPQDDPNLPKGNGRIVDTRAAVGLLSRSISIVSGCDNAGQKFPDPGMTCSNTPGTSYYFGGHTLVRQGFKSLQIQGVEFHQLGQGGRIMHYPVHFHMARKTPQPTAKTSTNPLPVTFIKDSTVWDSMTRWYTLHATQGVYMARNVGYLSIGHGYYLEDATETDNRLYSNLGIFARAAVENPQNPRDIPGILAGGYLDTTTDSVPYTSDVDHPTLFWITNGWNDFEYNKAVGANTCGVCYWLQPAGNSGFSRLQSWESYASEQKMTQTSPGVDVYADAGTTPLMKFVGNSCSTAMTSFLTVGQTTACTGVNSPQPVPQDYMPLIANSGIPPTAAPGVPLTTDQDYYYPKIDVNGSRFATKCPDTGDCSANLQPCASIASLSTCMVTVLDHYLTSFNWAQQGFAAIWLRPEWYLVSNSAITDTQTAGLTMITGGDYTQVIPGYWGLSSNDVFVGSTQDNSHYFAMNAGPFNKLSKQADPTLVCAGGGGIGGYCLNVSEGMSMPLSGFAVNQRMFSIYDGPSYQDSNAFLDVTPTYLDGCTQNSGTGCSGTNGWMYGLQTGLLLDPTKDADKGCYMPNAAIAWKQPNGFFYPPAFHTSNLYFENVDIRHFVIRPLFLPSGYLDPFKFDSTSAKDHYCTWNSAMFSGSWTDIDRQTELTDDDGTLTGLISKQAEYKNAEEVVVVNEDNFFRAPFQDIECGSDINTPPLSTTGTAISSPYEYVNTVEFPECAEPGHSCSAWAAPCTDQTCYGVPLYRLDVTNQELGQNPFILMMGAANYQRNTMTVNNGTYYIDTTVSQSAQNSAGFSNATAFGAGQTYYTFLLYAKPTTIQTYQMFIGKGLDPTLITGGSTIIFPVQVSIISSPPYGVTTGSTWPANWTKNYDATTGILTVTMNMTAADFTATECQPITFCKPGAQPGSCSCNLKTTDPTYTPSIAAQCSTACSEWAVKDIACPDAGCYGFGVTMPSAFSNATHVTPPTPACFPNTPDWNVGFAAGTKNSGGCVYTTLPSSHFCSKPNQ